ncbi:hypothetical protein BCV72DRAFT_220241 [Rhizopus microsporus var. microsporus]|uniref:Uncharacterized protein n=2 Tax=Rhizopus microsporus TaxID=58291 RepID=A0A2G4T012_RHIZD|nr:uncharacterized protein RHIMIDRAFT_278891 [Rhizopus microsporus ATCC 52813]XP_023468067.1 uncharacterized protein RHIMIDRAFT_278892 [Rhizopus microsporus ATCC 52813]ORE00871.1 hypothetical protein BCV72DRAFT_237318 [Rhizopus microsporus var. microsporus]ORE11332.1 hypothetical protein BCV72DRAFT_220241 [Rhizopus microsporus var. microsporus]PHZ14358.1 hypothetical protein RHIMIDRAFT_278891 [Rhizopus microsporus ATCC 52813]PHZ14359.1 hypothetical protein RHIMIDRAFT_278892 [Rhizopus microspor
MPYLQVKKAYSIDIEKQISVVLFLKSKCIQMSNLLLLLQVLTIVKYSSKYASSQS